MDVACLWALETNLGIYLLIGAYIILIGAAHSENYILFTGLEPDHGSDMLCTLKYGLFRVHLLSHLAGYCAVFEFDFQIDSVLFSLACFNTCVYQHAPACLCVIEFHRSRLDILIQRAAFPPSQQATLHWLLSKWLTHSKQH